MRPLKQAITAKDRLTLLNIITVADLRNEDVKEDLTERLLIPAIEALTALGEYGWPRAVWGRRAFTFGNLTEGQAKALLNALVPAPKLDWDDEEILAKIAEKNPNLVVDYFSARLSHTRGSGAKYDAVPFQFSRLDDALRGASTYVIDTARSWYANEPHLFMYRGGRFVVNVLSKEWDILEKELRRYLTDVAEDVEFILQTLRGFEGEEFLHPLLKDIVERIDPDSDAAREVEIVLEESGVVSGEFGFIQLHQQRRDIMKKWLEDSRPKVREFAGRHIKNLENRIAAEQQRAESDYELRKREWGDDDGLDELA